jgi:hypothetical protein
MSDKSDKRIVHFEPGKISKGGTNPRRTSSKRPKPPKGSGGLEYGDDQYFGGFDYKGEYLFNGKDPNGPLS